VSRRASWAGSSARCGTPGLYVDQSGGVGPGRGAETVVVFTAKVPVRLAAAAPICSCPRSRSMPESPPLGFHVSQVLPATSRLCLIPSLRPARCGAQGNADCSRSSAVGRMCYLSCTRRATASRSDCCGLPYGSWWIHRRLGSLSHIERSDVVFSTASSGEITMADCPDRRDYSACKHNPDECRQCDIAYDRAVSGAVRLYVIEFPKTAVPARTTPVGALEGRSIFCDPKCHKHYA